LSCAPILVPLPHITCLFFFSVLAVFHSYGFLFFFFNHTATTEIYTLSLHDALPIFKLADQLPQRHVARAVERDRFLPERGVEQHAPGHPIPDRPTCEQRLRPRPEARPLETHGHHDATVIGGRQVERPVEHGVAEMCS